MLRKKKGGIIMLGWMTIRRDIQGYLLLRSLQEKKYCGYEEEWRAIYFYAVFLREANTVDNEEEWKWNGGISFVHIVCSLRKYGWIRYTPPASGGDRSLWIIQSSFFFGRHVLHFSLLE